jgi:TrmH family RNA methyltransferase
MNEILTSTANPKLKFIRKLFDRKTREENNVFYIEGIRIVGEALNCHWTIKEVYYSPELIEEGYASQLIQLLEDQKIQIYKLGKDVFKSISIKDGPKGISAIVEKRQFPVENILNGGIWIALDRIQDPGNLGTIFRTADAIGASGVILIDNCTDPYDLSAIRSSMGAIFSLQIVKLTSSEFINFVHRNDILTIGTSDSAHLDYREGKYSENMILLMGSEREGLSDPLIKICSDLVKIPMVGKSDSLNLAVATGICLYEIFNQINPIK